MYIAYDGRIFKKMKTTIFFSWNLKATLLTTKLETIHIVYVLWNAFKLHILNNQNRLKTTFVTMVGARIITTFFLVNKNAVWKSQSCDTAWIWIWMAKDKAYILMIILVHNRLVVADSTISVHFLWVEVEGQSSQSTNFWKIAKMSLFNLCMQFRLFFRPNDFIWCGK